MNRAARLVGLLMALAPPCAGAQAWTGIAAVDSSRVARDAWSRAVSSLRAADTAAARRAITRAASAWPTQPAYLSAGMLLALRQRDTIAALSYVERYAGLGLGRSVSNDTTLAALLRAPAYERLRAELRAANEPLARSRVRRTAGDSTFWPEGIDADPRTGSMFVTSIRHRTIAEVAANGKMRELWPRDRSDVGAIFGVRVDTARGVLWATTSGVPQQAGYEPGDSATAGLLEIQPLDGRILRRWNLPPVAGGHVLGDLAVGPHGDVFVTDSNQPVLYWLHAGAGELDSISSPLFHSLQGLAPSPDGRWLFLTDYSHGVLRVDLGTRAVTRVADAPHSTSLGCDGIVWYRGGIIAVQNGVTPARIVRMELSANGDRIVRFGVIDRNSGLAPEPTIGTLLGDRFIYIANGQWDEHDAAGRVLPSAVLTPIRILELPLAGGRK